MRKLLILVVLVFLISSCSGDKVNQKVNNDSKETLSNNIDKKEEKNLKKEESKGNSELDIMTKEVKDLYDKKRFDLVKEKIDLIIKTHGNNKEIDKGYEAFINSQIFIEYKNNKLGQGDEVVNKIQEINNLYNAKKTELLGEKINELVSKYGSTHLGKHEGYDGFIKSDLYKQYIDNKLGQLDDVEYRIDDIKNLYNDNKYEQIEKSISELIGKYSATHSGVHQGYDGFIKSNIYKDYLMDKFGSKIIVNEMEELIKIYDRDGYNKEFEKKLDLFVKTYEKSHSGIHQGYDDFVNSVVFEEYNKNKAK